MTDRFDEQYRQLREVVAEANSLGIRVNSFTMRMLEIASARERAGNKIALTEPQMKAVEFQRHVNATEQATA